MYGLTIILINYNSSKYTFSCVESILNFTSKGLNYNIVIVDNNSEISDFQNLENKIDSLKSNKISIVRNYVNAGFGAANMIGCQFSKAKYYAFVNNDSLLLNDCFSVILEQMETNNEYGICGPQSYKENGELLPTLDHFSSPAKEIFGRLFLETINPTKYPKRKIEYSRPKRGQFVSGSFMVVRSDDFWKVGGFDTNIFLYQEETDLCIRLAKIKKYAYLIPDAKFIHFHGKSTPKSIAIKTELKISLLYVIKKHYGYWSYKIILTLNQLKYYFKSLKKPKYKALYKVLAKGGNLKYSLKNKQVSTL